MLIRRSATGLLHNSPSPAGCLGVQRWPRVAYPQIRHQQRSLASPGSSNPAKPALPQMPSVPHPNGLRLLALDGGGVRGIVSLIILDELMKRVQKKLGRAETCLPVDFFELAAGTSTGGIIAIMLFRLRMTAADAVDQYYKIAENVFKETLWGWDVSGWPMGLGRKLNNAKMVRSDTRFQSEPLAKAIDDVVEKFGLDEADREMKGKAPLFHPNAGRMFCCTTAQNRAETVLMKSYKHDDSAAASSIVNDAVRAGRDLMTISLAARATSAAPTFFPEVRWQVPGTRMVSGRNGKPARELSYPELVFWDGGLLNNNPIDQLWYSRYELVGAQDSEPDVSAVVSLGTGYQSPGKSPSSLFKLFQLSQLAGAVMDFATNTNAKGKDFSRHVAILQSRLKHEKMKYVRFQPHLGDSKIGLDDYKRMKDLNTLTREYLQDESGQEWIDKAVDAICPS